MQPGVETTNDAYVDADFSVIAPRVAGQIASVAVEDNQTVRKGQVLAQIDDRDYRAAFVAAQADVAMAEAEVENASASIVEQQATIDQASASFAAARANYVFARSDFGIPILRNMARAACKTRSRRAPASVHRAPMPRWTGPAQPLSARLNLAWTRIAAPIDG